MIENKNGFNITKADTKGIQHLKKSGLPRMPYDKKVYVLSEMIIYDFEF